MPSASQIRRDNYRAMVRKVACPECGAAPGYWCKGADGRQRVSNHRERQQASGVEGSDQWRVRRAMRATR